MRVWNFRDIELRLMGVWEIDLKCLKGFIGLIFLIWDVGMFVVLVLVEVLVDVMKF